MNEATGGRAAAHRSHSGTRSVQSGVGQRCPAGATLRGGFLTSPAWLYCSRVFPSLCDGATVYGCPAAWAPQADAPALAGSQKCWLGVDSPTWPTARIKPHEELPSTPPKTLEKLDSCPQVVSGEDGWHRASVLAASSGTVAIRRDRKSPERAERGQSDREEGVEEPSPGKLETTTQEAKTLPAIP